MLAQSFIESDPGMGRQLFDPCRLAMALDIGAAGIDRPNRVGDLAAHQFVVGVARTERHIRFALRQIEVAIAGHELDAKPRMTDMEAIDQRRFRHAVDDGFRARYPDHAGEFARGILDPKFEIADRGLDALGVRQQRLAKFGETIAGRMTHHQLPPDPTLHRRLAEPKRLPGRNGAVMPRDSEKISQIVPIEHWGIMHFCGRGPQCCGSRNCRSLARLVRASIVNGKSGTCASHSAMH